MQICNKCGQAVKYIVISHDEIITCNPEIKEVITETGHVVRGYEKHKCGEKNNVQAEVKL